MKAYTDEVAKYRFSKTDRSGVDNEFLDQADKFQKQARATTFNLNLYRHVAKVHADESQGKESGPKIVQHCTSYRDVDSKKVNQLLMKLAKHVVSKKKLPASGPP